MAAEVRCEIVTRDGARHEGFDSTQKELLRSRKKAHKQMTEIEKWYDVYMILFPGADPTSLPSPCESLHLLLRSCFTTLTLGCRLRVCERR